jgi:hypothetical protein
MLACSFEELFRRPDFVLEPRCWDTIVKYIQAGGKPDQLVECLSDSYIGELGHEWKARMNLYIVEHGEFPSHS